MRTFRCPGKLRRMLVLSDFESWPVLVQAGLVGVGVAMSWRGLHLSGDRGRLRLLWGALSVGSFIAALFVGAVANHDSAKLISDAQTDRTTAVNNLSDIKSSLEIIQDAMTKIAGAAKVDPNQSAQALADQIIGRLSSLQSQINQTGSRVAALEHPPQDQDSLYQDQKIVAKFIRGKLSADHKIFEFLKIYNANLIDFAKPIEFRSLVLQCQPHGIDAGMAATTLGMLSNVMDGVNCVVTSGDLITSPPAASPPFPAPPK
jgi:hypothetical protein